MSILFTTLYAMCRRAAQLRVLQLSMFLDEKTNKHVLRRLKNFGRHTRRAVLSTPKYARILARTVKCLPGNVLSC